MKAVILAGGKETSLNVLTKYSPKQMLPVVNRPLLEYLIDFLKRYGIKELFITLTHRPENIRDYFGDGREFGVKIRYSVEKWPRGTAGSLKNIEELVKDEHFLVIDGSVFLDMDLKKLFKFHFEKKSVATIGVVNENNNSHFFEGMETTLDNKLRGFHIIHPSRDRRSSTVSCGIRLFSPRVFDFIDGDSYVDIREQLIPSLRKANLPLYTFPVEGYCRRMNKVDDYFKINQDVLRMGANHENSRKEIMEGVWIGENVDISPGAYLLGPLVIGNNCIIEKGSQIIGPAVIGDGCKISEGSLVRESVIWSGASLPKAAKVEYCIIKNNIELPKDSKLQATVVMGERLNLGDVTLFSPDFKIRSISHVKPSSGIGRAGWKLHSAVSRAMDILISLIGIFFGLPLFLILSIAIKLDSRGPVFFAQKRCGKGGKEFTVYKLRSMVADAEFRHKGLLSRNEVNGPMFKLTHDPRLTRVGRFLRKTSLDELPQLLNVLKGQMSIVGPRPLKMEEMKFSPSWRDYRLKVAPGITGLWQVNGRSGSSFHDWINYDIYYVKNWSIWLDLKILVRTVTCVLRGIGAK